MILPGVALNKIDCRYIDTLSQLSRYRQGKVSILPGMSFDYTDKIILGRFYFKLVVFPSI